MNKICTANMYIYVYAMLLRDVFIATNYYNGHLFRFAFYKFKNFL